MHFFDATPFSFFLASLLRVRVSVQCFVAASRGHQCDMLSLIAGLAATVSVLEFNGTTSTLLNPMRGFRLETTLGDVNSTEVVAACALALAHNVTVINRTFSVCFFGLLRFSSLLKKNLS